MGKAARAGARAANRPVLHLVEVTAVASSYRLHYLLCAALWAAACQRDADAIFDDSGLAASGRAGTASVGEAGAEPSRGGSPDGTDAGAPAMGGTAGAGGTSAGTTADDGGESAGGSIAVAGKASGGTSAAGMSGAAGSAGSTPMDPKPVTYETRELDDAQIASCRPFENFGSETSFTVDASGNGGPGVCVYQVLLSAPLAALQKGAKIQSATLTLHCTNAGDALQVWYASGAWEEQQVTWMKRPERGASLGNLTCAQEGPVTFDLTTAAKAWLAGTEPSHGIYLTTEGDDGSDFASSEAKPESERPLLSLVYLPEK